MLDKVITHAAVIERLGFPVRRHRLVARQYREAINAQLDRLKPDVVVAVAAAHKVAYINPKWPLVYAADALYATVVGYYGKYSRLRQSALEQGNAVQCAMLERADALLLASQWACDAAIAAYGLAPEQLQPVAMGANLDIDPGFQQPSLGQPISLLFVGYAWERKGGPLLLDIWRALRARSGDAELHIVGADPVEARGLAGVTVHGRFDKSDREQYARLVDLYRRASFFVMPSREEAFGIVYCEAAAFGRPSIATDTGGVGGAIINDQTGLLVPFDATPEEYADRILDLWQQPDRYSMMCLAARRDYETRLNWTAWADAVSATITAVLERRASGAPRPTASLADRALLPSP